MPGLNRVLCWLRRDLRLRDHAALARATALGAQVIPVFVFDRNILDPLPSNDRRVTFIVESLLEMQRELERLGSNLYVLHGDPVEKIPQLADQLQVEAVVTAEDFEPYAIARDTQVREALAERNVPFEAVLDTVVMRPGTVLSQGGTPFRVYTPYSKAWKKLADTADFVPEHDLEDRHLIRKEEIDWPMWSYETIGFTKADLWLQPGESGAWNRLEEFDPKISQYAESRDFPAQSGTSGLSVHLRFGTVSIRELVRRALRKEQPGEKWLNELIWRDFYQDLLWHNPHVTETTFQPQFANLNWPGTESHWQAWCDGQTGYPIIDAAMRCLNQTGWMHNRLRMIVASFLTKDLLISYKRGEAYFAEKLLDFELSSNNGGWQWAASTGADAQPYFRIFNPVLQSERFDPSGTFIRTWVPELAELSDKAIHAPYAAGPLDLLTANVTLGKTYPHPIVNHAEQKDRAIQLLASAAKKS
jgi:deoxyribodipyrimidine photo-lyase